MKEKIIEVKSEGEEEEGGGKDGRLKQEDEEESEAMQSESVHKGHLTQSEAALKRSKTFSFVQFQEIREEAADDLTCEFLPEHP